MGFLLAASRCRCLWEEAADSGGRYWVTSALGQSVGGPANIGPQIRYFRYRHGIVGFIGHTIR